MVVTAAYWPLKLVTWEETIVQTHLIVSRHCRHPPPTWEWPIQPMLDHVQATDSEPKSSKLKAPSHKASIPRTQKAIWPRTCPDRWKSMWVASMSTQTILRPLSQALTESRDLRAVQQVWPTSHSIRETCRIVVDSKRTYPSTRCTSLPIQSTST